MPSGDMLLIGVSSGAGVVTADLLLLETGTPDNLLLETGDALLLNP